MTALQVFEKAAKAVRGAYFYTVAFRGAWTEPFTTAQAAREEAARKALEAKEAEEECSEPGDMIAAAERAAAEALADTYHLEPCSCGCGQQVYQRGPAGEDTSPLGEWAWAKDLFVDPTADTAPIDPSSSIPAWQPADDEGGEVDSGIHPPPTSPHLNPPATAETPLSAVAGAPTLYERISDLRRVDLALKDQARDAIPFRWHGGRASAFAEVLNLLDAETDRLGGVSPQFHHWFEAAATFPQYQKRTEK